jgi:hypothetical protein
MTDAEAIDKKLRELRLVGQTEVARQMDPPGHEKNPPAFQRKQEQEGRSEWSGGKWGGRQR